MISSPTQRDAMTPTKDTLGTAMLGVDSNLLTELHNINSNPTSPSSVSTTRSPSSPSLPHIIGSSVNGFDNDGSVTADDPLSKPTENSVTICSPPSSVTELDTPSTIASLGNISNTSLSHLFPTCTPETNVEACSVGDVLGNCGNQQVNAPSSNTHLAANQLSNTSFTVPKNTSDANSQRTDGCCGYNNPQADTNSMTISCSFEKQLTTLLASAPNNKSALEALLTIAASAVAFPSGATLPSLPPFPIRSDVSPNSCRRQSKNASASGSDSFLTSSNKTTDMASSIVSPDSSSGPSSSSLQSSIAAMTLSSDHDTVTEIGKLLIARQKCAEDLVKLQTELRTVLCQLIGRPSSLMHSGSGDSNENAIAIVTEILNRPLFPTFNTAFGNFPSSTTNNTNNNVFHANIPVFSSTTTENSLLNSGIETTSSQNNNNIPQHDSPNQNHTRSSVISTSTLFDPVYQRGMIRSKTLPSQLFDAEYLNESLFLQDPTRCDSGGTMVVFDKDHSWSNFNAELSTRRQDNTSANTMMNFSSSCCNAESKPNAESATITLDSDWSRQDLNSIDQLLSSSELDSKAIAITTEQQQISAILPNRRRHPRSVSFALNQHEKTILSNLNAESDLESNIDGGDHSTKHVIAPSMSPVMGQVEILKIEAKDKEYIEDPLESNRTSRSSSIISSFSRSDRDRRARSQTSPAVSKAAQALFLAEIGDVMSTDDFNSRRSSILCYNDGQNTKPDLIGLPPTQLESSYDQRMAGSGRTVKFRDATNIFSTCPTSNDDGSMAFLQNNIGNFQVLPTMMRLEENMKEGKSAEFTNGVRSAIEQFTSENGSRSPEDESALATPTEAFGGMPGSYLELHEQGRCKPCAFFYNKRKGCQNGDNCTFCHHSDHSKLTLKQWKKKQQKLLKASRINNQAQSERFHPPVSNFENQSNNTNNTLFDFSSYQATRVDPNQGLLQQLLLNTELRNAWSGRGFDFSQNPLPASPALSNFVSLPSLPGILTNATGKNVAGVASNSHQPPPPGFSHQPSPTGFNHQHSPTGFNHQPSPTGFNHQPSATGFNHQPSPTGFNHLPSPTGFNHLPSPTGFNHQPSPTGFNHQPSPTGYNHQSSPTGYNHQPSPPADFSPMLSHDRTSLVPQAPQVVFDFTQHRPILPPPVTNNQFSPAQSNQDFRFHRPSISMDQHKQNNSLSYMPQPPSDAISTDPSKGIANTNISPLLNPSLYLTTAQRPNSAMYQQRWHTPFQ